MEVRSPLDHCGDVAAASSLYSCGRMLASAADGELEGPEEVVECEGDTPCPLRSACRLRGAL
ncbi:transcriptional regulator, partial [Streptomyces sp. NPDC026589]